MIFYIDNEILIKQQKRTNFHRFHLVDIFDKFCRFSFIDARYEVRAVD